MIQRKITIGDHDIEILAGLGQGTYGSVYLIDMGGVKKAIKVITNPGKDGIKSLREIDIMSRIVHPNLVRAEGIIVGINRNNPAANIIPAKIPGFPDLPPILPLSPAKENVTLGIIMALANTDLQRHMKLPEFTINQRLKILYDISKGLEYLHENGILHMDLKPMNILLFGEGDNMTAKLTDFGLALLLENDEFKYYPSELVTITHRSPEIINGDRIYTRAGDIWSLGIIFLEVLSGGKVLFNDFSKSHVKKTINNLFKYDKISHTLDVYLSGIHKSIKHEAISLLKSMLNFDINLRPKTNEILNSPLFKNVQKQDNKGTKMYRRPYPPRKCDVIYYYGFDFMVRMGMKLAISTETFFLAGDIYQRALAYANLLSGDFNRDWANVSLMAVTSLYMAVKIIEPYNPDPVMLTKLASNVFEFTDIIRVEASLTQMFDGVLYPRNLFTDSVGEDRLIYAFDNLIRNCHLYHRMDLDIWVSDGKKKIEIPYKKYIPFSDFIHKTKYYNLIKTQEQNIYVPHLYAKDIEIGKSN
jgi:serine/threonine protein kinase